MISKKILDNKSKKTRNILTIVDNMIVYILSNKTLNSIITELLTRG